jgi:uncharacterized membrane protein (Fun14 family)
MNSIVESFGSTAAILGGGFFVGILIGYALKKVIKIVAVIVGLFLAGLAYLQYHQIATINRNKLQQVSEGVLMIVTIMNILLMVGTVTPPPNLDVIVPVLLQPAKPLHLFC